MSATTTNRLREIALALEPGALLPPERELAERLGVARMTLRNAIDALRREGLIRTRPYVGTERIGPAVSLRVGLRSFASAVREHGMEPRTAVLHLALDHDRPREASEHLRLDDSEPAWHVRRVRFGDDRPLALEETWLARAMVPELDLQAAAGSLYDLLGDLDLRPTDGVELVTAALPSDAEIEQLELDRSAPVLRLSRAAFVGDRPVEYALVTFPADRYELTFPLASVSGTR